MGIPIMSNQLQIDDLLDARADVRALRKALTAKRIELADIRARLTTASDRLENLLTELEQQQGRLPFGADEPAEAPAKAPAKAPPPRSNGRKHRQPAAAGQSDWREGR
jgi:hypothetical protein